MADGQRRAATLGNPLPPPGYDRDLEPENQQGCGEPDDVDTVEAFAQGGKIDEAHRDVQQRQRDRDFGGEKKVSALASHKSGLSDVPRSGRGKYTASLGPADARSANTPVIQKSPTRLAKLQ